MTTLVLAVVAGAGIGFFLGQHYILSRIKKGILLPSNFYGLPAKPAKEPEVELKVGGAVTSPPVTRFDEERPGTFQ